LAGDCLEKLKVLIVDNSAFFKKILTQTVESTGLGIVKNTASSGALAVERLSQGNTDVVLLDIFTIEANLLDILEEIHSRFPDIFIILLVSPGSKIQVEELKDPEIGVMDFIRKPPAATAETNINSMKQRMQGLFSQMIARRFTSRTNMNPAPPIQPTIPLPPPPTAVRIRRLSGVDLVLIASSTGGPTALETVCKNLPESFDKPVLVVQHMPADLTGRMAQSLDKKCRLPVMEAADGDTVRPGQIMIAPGGFHITVQSVNGVVTIKVESTPPVNGVKPSADVLFRSVARLYQNKRVLAVILTGMGKDGMQGIEELKKSCECFCLTQSEKTCVVYGMPKSVVEAGFSDAVEDLASIPSRILQIVSGRG